MKKSSSGIFIFLGMIFITAALGLTAFNRITAYVAGQKSADILEKLTQVRGSGNNEPAPSPWDTAENTGGDLFSGLTPDTFLHRESEVEIPDYVLDAERSMPAREIDGIAYVGTLSFPSLDLELPVAASWDYDTLRVTPCLYSGSAYRDNMVICAHNYTVHFGRIGLLPAGAEVRFTDMDGNCFRYQVDDMELIRPNAVDEMTGSDYALSLFTCTMDGQKRLTLRCLRQGEDALS